MMMMMMVMMMMMMMTVAVVGVVVATVTTTTMRRRRCHLTLTDRLAMLKSISLRHVNPNIKLDTLDIADRLDVEILATCWIASSEVVREFAQTSHQITQLNPNLFLPATRTAR